MTFQASVWGCDGAWQAGFVCAVGEGTLRARLKSSARDVGSAARL